MKFGINILWESLYKKIKRANWNFKMADFFKMAASLVEKVRDVPVNLSIKTWNLVWTFSKGGLIRMKSEVIEIPRWPPFFKMAASLVERIGDVPVNLGIKLKFQFHYIRITWPDTFVSSILISSDKHQHCKKNIVGWINRQKNKQYDLI